jgi:ABC-type nickel/cobalt efflux system permease component RcnA
MRPIRLALLGLAALLVAAAAAHAAASPFGIATPDSSGGGFGGPLGPFFAWVALRQAEFYRSMTAALSAVKANGSAPWILLGISFAYGVFHAAGPGHGKAVISSYLVSSGESAKRGILISFAAAIVQAFVAIAIVAVASIALKATAQTMTAASNWIEIVSYALIAAVGAFLLWTKIAGGHHHHHHHHFAGGDDHGHDHAGHAHDHDHVHGVHDHGHGADHGHDHDHARHDHGQPVRGKSSSGTGWFAKPWSAVLAVGIRPCSGAIIVLVFALSQGLFAVGILATLVMALGTGLTVAVLAILAVTARGLAVALAGTESPAAVFLVRAAEIGGAAVVLLFGLVLLGGALSAGLAG